MDYTVSAGVISKVVGERRIFATAGDGETGVPHIPRGHGAGIRDIESEVFKFHWLMGVGAWPRAFQVVARLGAERTRDRKFHSTA